MYVLVLEVARIVKLTPHLLLVPRSGMCGAIPPLPEHLHGVVLRAQGQNYLTLPYLKLSLPLKVYDGLHTFHSLVLRM